MTKHLSPKFTNAKQVQNCVPKECKGESKKIPKHHFDTKHFSGCSQTYFRSLKAKTYGTKFSTTLMELVTHTAPSSESTWPQFICQSSSI